MCPWVGTLAEYFRENLYDARVPAEAWSLAILQGIGTKSGWPTEVGVDRGLMATSPCGLAVTSVGAARLNTGGFVKALEAAPD